ncbi:type III restriction/modification enzyme restriction subunit [Mucilaginibacter oryzae]|uniref:Type III restriction/modification enzyme restriction subunit n=1 Tax=Mucilaginibacter oryzae TaxID=468058 RepID=A0A316H9A2_9SPHI|nr:helicase-related protein [Mucilaginibacter oryzae]PWK76570.1 type III restriction/modification enzyme restriction subunit [Mucilaginibacter oryzae]
MASNFFTNQSSNTLYKKFVGVFEHMQNIEYFKSVIGYFRASGYFAIRKHFPETLKIKIIAGINVDPFIALAQKQGLLFNANAKDTKQSFIEFIQEDVINAKYGSEIEEGILQLISDIIDNRIEIRAHNSKKLHSKFYIFLSPNFNEHNPNGLVIMGSSNLSAQGLGLENVEHNYEMNVELRDYENVKFANTEFEMLWSQSTPILPVDAPSLIKKTYLAISPTPFELYVKFLIEFFGKNIEYDPDSISDIPLKKFKKLSYQIDAVNQGYELLLKHNGFFLADVVGTGKTVMAALLAKKFIISNGAKTKILIVFPPALEKNWKSTFKEFRIDEKCDFISNGSLDKIINEEDPLKYKEKYDLVLVDEAHKFRNHSSRQFQNLQIICKSGRENIGNIEGFEKKIVLISATPLNNRPEDIYYLISLFQDVRNSNLNEPNLQKFFYPHIIKYKALIQQAPLDLQGIQDIFNDIRDKVIKDITIRRTRTDLNKNERYAKDLKEQGIVFPTVVEPFANEYELTHNLAELFLDTANSIIDKNKIDFFRYQAIAYLTDEANDGLYQSAQTIGRSLASIMQTQLIKRLESSFYAFKKSLNKITTSTKQMIEMYERDSVFIAPDLDITELLNKGYTDEEIELEILKIDDDKPKNKKFKQSDFKQGFIEGLRRDYEHLAELNKRWQAVDESNDPKWNVFITLLKDEYFNPTKNELGKLVIFTESADTLSYLMQRLSNETSYKVLSITSDNRNKMFEAIRENFDANYEGTFRNDYDIILTTDVLAEGINLHRANVIVNYDTPWNPTKLIQRLGRINRIGTKAQFIYNYNFYPSEQGDNRINLRQKSLAKLQSSHSTFGEDNRIYTLEEIIDQFKMFEEKEEDKDLRTQYLEWLRKFREQNPEQFNEIRKMPLKVRCMRNSKGKQQSIAFVKNGEHKNIYIYTDGGSKSLPFEQAVKIFEASVSEKDIKSVPELHYQQINHILRQFERDITIPEMIGGVEDKMDVRSNKALNDLNNWLANQIIITPKAIQAGKKLMPLLKNGTYTNLTNEVYKLRNETDPIRLENEIIRLERKYTSKVKRPEKLSLEPIQPQIIISETFV